MSHTMLQKEKKHMAQKLHANKDYKVVTQLLGVKVHSIVIEITGTHPE